MRLSPELYPLIISHLKFHPSSLKACSLVHSSWRNQAQSYLFATLQLSLHCHSKNEAKRLENIAHQRPFGRSATITPNVKPLSDGLVSNPRLANYVTCLHIRVHYHWGHCLTQGYGLSALSRRKMAEHFCVYLPKLLMALQTQHIKHFIYQGPQFFLKRFTSMFPEPTINALRTFLCSTNLVSFQFLRGHIQDFSFMFRYAVHSPRLHTLALGPLPLDHYLSADWYDSLPTTPKIKTFIWSAATDYMAREDHYSWLVRSTPLFKKLESINASVRLRYGWEGAPPKADDLVFMIRLARDTLRQLRVDIVLNDSLFDIISIDRIRVIHFDLYGKRLEGAIEGHKNYRNSLKAMLIWITNSFDKFVLSPDSDLRVELTLHDFRHKDDVLPYIKLWQQLDLAMASIDIHVALLTQKYWTSDVKAVVNVLHDDMFPVHKDKLTFVTQSIKGTSSYRRDVLR